nr:hypothetical protein [Pseudothauera rhizosphaerae]
MTSTLRTACASRMNSNGAWMDHRGAFQSSRTKTTPLEDRTICILPSVDPTHISPGIASSRGMPRAMATPSAESTESASCLPFSRVVTV